MKGYTESRGVCLQQDFDVAAGTFVSRPIRHPFMDAIGTAVQAIRGPENQVVSIAVAKPNCRVPEKTAVARKVA